MNLKQAAFFLTLFLAFSLGVSQAMASEKIYLMTGKIEAIDQEFNTVVIEVPLGEHLFTVGGPLSSDAILKKGGKSAILKDFTIGEKARVKWKSTDKGHIIEAIESP